MSKGDGPGVGENPYYLGITSSGRRLQPATRTPTMYRRPNGSGDDSGVVMGGFGLASRFRRDQRTENGVAPTASLDALRRETVAELKDCRIVEEVLAGRSRQEDYVAYLINVYHYARFSPVIMAAAAARTSQTYPELSLYLLRHAAEEQGHDTWALDDLEKLGVAKGTVEHTRPVPACRALVSYAHDLATARNPIAVFGWMYILEAVGADIGTAAGEKLGEAHGGAVPPVHFVQGHGSADAVHTMEIASQINAHITATNDREDVSEAAGVVSHLYTTMFRQIGGEQARWVSP